jgi:hypothetical protein
VSFTGRLIEPEGILFLIVVAKRILLFLEKRVLVVTALRAICQWFLKDPETGRDPWLGLTGEPAPTAAAVDLTPQTTG